ncbi:hypothetical protein NM688_g7858 [Phlebia brevispora]|uniref:Uncharacterized protein n=1 Tax=Phlebia brevispora TaxID=194682 RepID=A0ACC1S0B7_9APHY|nr:hypothetical protein NM688_g7858 [Phlebia brevispora]
MSSTVAPPAPTKSTPTDYGTFVTSVMSRMTKSTGKLDQQVLRQCLGLASSYLVSDTTMSPASGLASWHAGFNRLVDVLVALHRRNELELETVSQASKACSECWSVAGTWRELEDCRESVRGIAVRLKSILDENGHTYRGGHVYVP